MNIHKQLCLLALICLLSFLLGACMMSGGNTAASGNNEAAATNREGLPELTENLPVSSEPAETTLAEPRVLDAEYADLKFFDDGSRTVTVAYLIPNADGTPDPEQSGEAIYELNNTVKEEEGPIIRFLPDSLTGINDFSLPVTDASDRAFLLGELDTLAAPEDGRLPEVRSNPVYLYVDEAKYAFYRTGEILGDGVCGACSDFFRISALSYKYLAPNTGELELNSTLLLYSDGMVQPDCPPATEENYQMWIVGSDFQWKLSLSQALEFKTGLLGNAFLSGVRTDWDWQQPVGGICLVETLENFENRIWLYPDGSIGIVRSDGEGPWKDGSILYGQSDWDIYKTSWQRVYLIRDAFSWDRLEQILTTMG